MKPSYLRIHPEVEQALRENQAVVALESTIIAHGMPYPQNVETAKRVEAEIRSCGAIPATIAVIDGAIKVGLTDAELERMGSTPGVAKVSRRDLPILLANRMLGATTVATTMIGAQMAGIQVFVTGGIGGVHRGAETSFDVSADLEELATTNVAVVCAGAKSILDLGLTMEYLETKGVPVIGYQTDTLPAFYTRESSFPVDARVDTAQAAAAIIHAKWSAGLQGGVVIANPIPKEHAMDPAFINGIIDEAIVEAQKEHITGKAVSPYLLSRIKERSEGRSLDSNIELVLNNARLGAHIAIELTKRD
jgi:pseudouridine-5'-phosphate glycosidase